jgi:hypothetical protein
MILFLRNKRRQTIVDLDCYVKTEYEGNTSRKFVEISADVAIDTYSKFLLENLDRKDEIIEDFTIISELRGWLWEKYFCGGDNDPEEYNNIIKQLQALLQGIAEKYDLYYVED